MFVSLSYACLFQTCMAQGLVPNAAVLKYIRSSSERTPIHVYECPGLTNEQNGSIAERLHILACGFALLKKSSHTTRRFFGFYVVQNMQDFI